MLDRAQVRAEIAATLRRMSEMSSEMHEQTIVTHEVIIQSREFMRLADARLGSALIRGRYRLR